LYEIVIYLLGLYKWRKVRNKADKAESIKQKAHGERRKRRWQTAACCFPLIVFRLLFIADPAMVRCFCSMWKIFLHNVCE